MSTEHPEQVSGKGEIIEHEWLTLAALWRRIKGQSLPSDWPARNAETVALIETLLKQHAEKTGRGYSWVDFNAAEQAVGSELGPDDIGAEYATLLQAAEDLKLPDVASYQGELEKFSKADSEVNPAIKRAIYLRLLYRIQSFLVLRRSERGFRGMAATTIFKIGSVAGLVFMFTAWAGFAFLDNILGPACSLAGKGIGGGADCADGADKYFGLLLGISAVGGALGACFSRALDLRDVANALAFSDYISFYTARMLVFRMLCGAIGAVVLFLLMRAGLAGGGLFPDFAGDTVWIPEYAKLLLWMFLAGFSERLVPSLLNQAAGQATVVTPTVRAGSGGAAGGGSGNGAQGGGGNGGGAGAKAEAAKKAQTLANEKKAEFEKADADAKAKEAAGDTEAAKIARALADQKKIEYEAADKDAKAKEDAAR